MKGEEQGGLRLLALEPYHGGSHRAVLDGLLQRLESRGWRTEALTMPARKWKWRMRGSAISFAQELSRRHLRWKEAHPSGEPGERRPDAAWDIVFASTFVNLAELKGLAGEALAGVPCVVYFHENQLVYPVRHEQEWDLQFPLTNITSALAADGCLFNSDYTRDSFLREIPPFIKRFPDRHPKGLAEAVALKSEVLPPPFDPAPLDSASLFRGERCRFVWPHRWEHDKDPATFFEAVSRLADDGLDFEVAVAGQSFEEVPAPIRRAGEHLGERLVHIGEPPTREAYAELLKSSDVAVSTAVNEFFGLAMVEACYAGCRPLVPDRVAYSSLYPDEYRWHSLGELVERLRLMVAQRPEPGMMGEWAKAYTFDALLPAYERSLHSIAKGRTPSS